jgi:hypothetical protein
VAARRAAEGTGKGQGQSGDDSARDRGTLRRTGDDNEYAID